VQNELWFCAVVPAVAMFQKSCIPDFSKTCEAGSRVLMSNSHEVRLAQLVTRDHSYV
jgi:hypothetical protein